VAKSSSKPRRSRGLERARYISKVATPSWLSRFHRNQTAKLYSQAKKIRQGGREVQVDHIVPLFSPYVCGLHVPWNLRIYPTGPNRYRANNYWPECPWENHTWLEHEFPEPHQLRLF